MTTNFIDGIVAEKNHEGATILDGFVNVDGVKYVGASTIAISKKEQPYHKFVGKDENGHSIQVSMFLKDNFTPEDRERKRPYLSGVFDFKQTTYNIVGWIRERKDGKGEFISLAQSKPRPEGE
jgi:hypothetical protein